MKHLISASPAPDWNYYLKRSRVKQGAFKPRKVKRKNDHGKRREKWVVVGLDSLLDSAHALLKTTYERVYPSRKTTSKAPLSWVNAKNILVKNRYIYIYIYSSFL